MYQNWNSYNTTKATYGGLVPIWVEQPDRAESGGMLVNNNFSKGEIISGGSAVAFDTATKLAKILKVFKVTDTEVVDTNTKITVSQVGNLHKLNTNDIVMVLPATLTGTGKGVSVGTVDTSVAGVASFTVATANIDSVATGTYLVSAAASGSAKAMYCIPTSLTIDDTVVADRNSVGIAVGDKYVYSNTIPWLPTIIANNIKMLETATFNTGA